MHILGDAHNRVKVVRQEFPEARVVVFGHSPAATVISKPGIKPKKGPRQPQLTEAG